MMMIKFTRWTDAFDFQVLFSETSFSPDDEMICSICLANLLADEMVKVTEEKDQP